MTEVPEVLVLGVVGFSVDLEGDVLSLSVLDFLLTGLELPSSPRSDDLHVGSVSLDGKLKTNLVVALAGAAVADSVSALSLGDLYDSLGDNGTCEGGAEKVLALVNSASLDGGEYIFFNEFLVEILDVELGSACSDSLLLETVELGTLTDVARNGDNLTVVVIFL